MTHVRCLLVEQGYTRMRTGPRARAPTHTHAHATHIHTEAEMCNTYCFSTATMVSQVLRYMYIACLILQSIRLFSLFPHEERRLIFGMHFI